MSNRTLPQTTKDLIAAKKLIENEDDWCVGALINKSGQMCALGALCMASTGHPQALNGFPTEGFSILERAAHLTSGAFVIDVNNDLGHTAVMQMFDKAIAESLKG